MSPAPALPTRQPAWPETGNALARFVADLIADEVQRLRPGGAALPPGPWPRSLSLADDGLGLDSLERLNVGAALNEALHLHESGVEDLLLARPSFGEWQDIALAGLRHHSAQLSFRTSGSSGQPKSCTHTLQGLQEEVAHLAQLLAGARRVVSAVPAHHIYGFLFTVLLPACLGGLPVVDVRLLTPQALARHLQRGDLLISHPAHWALVARHAGALPAGVTGVSSTAPCPDDLAQALVQGPGGLQRLVQVYGSSETAGIGWRETPGAPYQLMPHWRRGPAAGLPAGSDDPGETEPGAADTITRLTQDGTPLTLPLQDRLHWHDERRFSVLGRRDAAVQVGGTNVFPARVRSVLCEHPQVADAAVRLMAPHEGQRLKAFIVPRPGADTAALPAELTAWVQARLSTAERPRAFTLGAQLPVNAQGKACDWPLGANPDAPDPR